RVEPSAERSHGGEQALRLYAVSPSRKMSLTKASLDTELLHFIKGDHFWFSGWFFLEKGRPTTIMDLECSYIEKSPGMRVLFTEEMRPYLELKWMSKPTYRPQRSLNVVLPRRRWVHVKVHLLLSEGNDGEAELWLDGMKVIEGKGQTLPISGAVYDRLQVGITANPKETTTVLYVDDVMVSDTRLK
ncbi:MAG: heparin lyase I family protein, partial [Pirellulales bacterium]